MEKALVSFVVCALLAVVAISGSESDGACKIHKVDKCEEQNQYTMTYSIKKEQIMRNDKGFSFKMELPDDCRSGDGYEVNDYKFNCHDWPKDGWYGKFNIKAYLDEKTAGEKCYIDFNVDFDEKHQHKNDDDCEECEDLSKKKKHQENINDGCEECEELSKNKDQGGV